MNAGTRSVVVLPLDDRPVNTKDVLLAAQAASSQAILPPREMLPPRGVASDVAEIHNWLLSRADGTQDYVISINQLLFGGYVASRRTTSDIASVLGGLEVIAEIRKRAPESHISAHMTVMRTKDINDGGAEPEYWSDYGVSFGALSREIYRAEHGLTAEADSVRPEIPEAYVQDYLQRRLRLATVHYALISMVGDGIIDDLAFLVEDSTPQSLSSTERELIDLWISRLALGEKVQCLPGADEAGASFTMRAILRQRCIRPKVFVECSNPATLETVAQYEDVPLRNTVAQQLWMAGASEIDSAQDADLVLVIHPPAPTPHDWCRKPREEPAPADVAGTVSAIRSELELGRRVAVVDLAYANGSDPELVSALNDASLLYELSGYAGWNTAGNSIGSAVVQGCAATVGKDSTANVTQKHLLTRRVLDEGAYQADKRRRYLQAEIDPGDSEHLEAELIEVLGSLQSDFHKFELKPGSTKWPWLRAFEIDFDLQKRKSE